MKDKLQIQRDAIDESISHSKEIKYDRDDENDFLARVKKPSYVQSCPEINSYVNNSV